MRQAHPIPFFAVMALLPMVGVPVTPFFILAGAAFRTRVAVAGSIVALGLNLAGCYLLARKMQPRIDALLRRLDYELPDFGARKKGSTRATLAVKFAPGLPAFVKNYGLALAGVAFPPYFILSMLISGTYGVSIIVLGKSLFDHDRNRILLVGISLVAARPRCVVVASPPYAPGARGTGMKGSEAFGGLTWRALRARGDATHRRGSHGCPNVGVSRTQNSAPHHHWTFFEGTRVVGRFCPSTRPGARTKRPVAGTWVRLSTHL